MAEAPGAGSAGGQQETRDGPHLRPSFLLSERPPVAGGDGRDAGCQADTPPGSGQQVFRRSGSRRSERALMPDVRTFDRGYWTALGLRSRGRMSSTAPPTRRAPRPGDLTGALLTKFY